MNRRLAVFAALVLVACGEPTAPTPLYSGYFLATVDGQPLPVPYAEDGTQLIANLLDFGGQHRPRSDGASSGTVQYLLDLRRPDQSVEHSEIGLNYTAENDVLRIDLCPPLALCFASTELIGPISPDRAELRLTYYLAGRPGSVYRYVATLPE